MEDLAKKASDLKLDGVSEQDLVDARHRVFLTIRIPFALLASTAAPALGFYLSGLLSMGPTTFFGWLIAMLSVSSIATAATAFSKYTNKRINKHGLPLGFFTSAVLLALAQGSAVFLDREPTFELLTVLVGSTLGSIGAIAITFGAIRSFAQAMIVAVIAPISLTPWYYGEIQWNLIGIFMLGLPFAFYFPQVQTKRFEEMVMLRKFAEIEAEKARVRSNRDSLTGLQNRSGISGWFDTLKAHQVRGVLFCDLDGFKDVNDRLGHEVGDNVLVLVGRRLANLIDGHGEVARLGGDEFLVVITSGANTRDIANQLISTLEEPFVVGEEEIYISASVGISKSQPTLDSDFSDYLRRSDYALYQAKKTGRGQAVEFSKDLEAERRATFEIRDMLRRSARSGEFDVWGQPIYDVATGSVSCIELLSRWSGSFENVPASVFIPHAEETGIIDAITELALERFAQFSEQWRGSEHLDGVKFAVNISPLSLERGRIKDQIIEICTNGGADPSKLVIEITESAVFDREDRALSDLHELRELGIGIALDDFGTGFSSLSRFFEMPITEVKLDKSLINGICDIEQKQTMTRAIVMMSNSLGRNCTAEGIETAEQLEIVRNLGVSHGQGYLLCRPTRLDELPDRVRGYFGRRTSPEATEVVEWDSSVTPVSIRSVRQTAR